MILPKESQRVLYRPCVWNTPLQIGTAHLRKSIGHLSPPPFKKNRFPNSYENTKTNYYHAVRPEEHFFPLKRRDSQGSEDKNKPTTNSLVLQE